MGQNVEWVSRIRESQVPSFYEADLGESFRQKSLFDSFFDRYFSERKTRVATI